MGYFYEADVIVETISFFWFSNKWAFCAFNYRIVGDSITSQLVTSHVTNWTQIWLLTCPKYVFAFLEYAYAVLEHAYAVLEQVYAVLELFYAVLEQGDVTNWDFMKQNF